MGKHDKKVQHGVTTVTVNKQGNRFGRLIRELRALPMATTPGGENNLSSAIFFRILYVPHSKMFNFQTYNFLYRLQ